MKILSVNAGSSSLKFQAYEMPEEKVLISGTFERIGIDGSFYTVKINGEKIKKEVSLPNHEGAVRILTEELLNYNVVEDLSEIKGVGHRVVHGGDIYAESAKIDDKVLNDIESLFSLAPLHNPANMIGIKAFQSIIPNAVQVAVFDTAFHQTIEKDRFLYPVPYEWYTKYAVRKYGFHGTSHKYIANRTSEIMNRNDLKVISCHIGNGGSVSAIKNGICIDTSMGFTPNAGIMMGSRSGDIDVTLVPHVMKNTGMSIDDIVNSMNKKSGLLGISEVSSDFRDVISAVKDGNEQAILARTMYIERIVDYIARYYVELNGCDAIVFTAGVGENNADIRKDILNRLAVLGIEVDEESNASADGETLITTSTSKIAAYVIPTDEEVMIARDTFSFIQ